MFEQQTTNSNSTYLDSFSGKIGLLWLVEINVKLLLEHIKMENPKPYMLPTTQKQNSSFNEIVYLDIYAKRSLNGDKYIHGKFQSGVKHGIRFICCMHRRTCCRSGYILINA